MGDLTKPILFRPTPENVRVLEILAQRNAQVACTTSDLLRLALQFYADSLVREKGAITEGATDVQSV